MTRELDVDRVLRDWLAEGPSRFPDRAIDATIGQLDDIQHRKLSWLPGRRHMTRFLVPATGLAAALIVAVLGWSSINDGVGPGGPASVDFTSERHAYTVTLPDEGWTREERLGTWPLGEFFDANSISGVDYYERPPSADRPALYVYLATQPIPDGMAFPAWIATHDAATDAAAGCFEPVGDDENALVDGEQARVAVRTCPTYYGATDGAWTTVQTMVAHDGRGYAIYLWPVESGSAMPPVADLRREAADWLSGFSFSD
jgi:hypothetical protein